MKEVTLYKISTETIVVDDIRTYLEIRKVDSLPQRVMNSDEVVAFREADVDTTPIHRLCRNDSGVTRHWYVAYDSDLRKMLDEYTALTQSKFDALKNALDNTKCKLQARTLDLDFTKRLLGEKEKVVREYQEMSFWQRLKWAFKGG